LAYHEDDLIPLSFLSQYYYCHRRAGLMLIERQWSDNIHTVSGSIIHGRVNEARTEKRADLIRLTSLPLRSLKLGLFGIADCIEFYANEHGFSIPGFEGKWEVAPVEYKHGKVRDELEYEVQLTGQAMCLEEMLGITIPKGYIYFAGDRRRKEVLITVELKKLVQQGAEALHQMLETATIPPIEIGNKCKECSLADDCFPLTPLGSRKSKRHKTKASAVRYIKAIWDDIESGEEK
jgi:CRISPR-associated exonuclease Cas4